MTRIVAGEFRSRKIKVPEGLDIRPTTNQVREAVFNICQHIIEGARFLDVCAGSGAMGFEALSRGAEFVTFIDSGKSSIRCIGENVKDYGVQAKCAMLCGDAIKVLQQLDQRGEGYNLIYIDPPYDLDLYFELLKIIDQGNLVKPGGRVFIEAAYNAKINLPLEGYESLTFYDRRRYGVSELFQFTRNST